MAIDVRLSAFGPGLSVPAAVAAGCFARYVVAIDGLCRGGRASGSDSWAAFPIHEIDHKFRASRSRLNGPRGWIVETEPKKTQRLSPPVPDVGHLSWVSPIATHRLLLTAVLHKQSRPAFLRMQAVECGEMSSFELADSVAKTGCSHNPVNLSPIVPPSVTGSFTPEPALRRLPASARGAKPVA